jgi:replicative DNA helicase
MRDVDLINRVISAYSGISGDSIRKGIVTDAQLATIGKASSRIAKLPIFIDHSSGLSINEIVARAKLQHMRGGVDLVVVDYLQLVRAKADNRTQEIGAVSRALKGLAKEIGAPVLALSQLNRSVESRPDKRPKLSDLRESGEIEQDADIVSFIYRDEYYHPDSTFKGTAEVITAKQRNGPTGVDLLSFSGEFSTFGNVDMQRGAE